ncbi:iron chelate uptake ABC transporter family permease subunit [Nocardiopsis sp. EMB25]|uniref:FecCD family ABC transporter permease n=1 Tax=Nocardiopsis sp. EMB25 TaxID=2835867 RepID=UPI002283938A|nr:iron chelate uptake ABC transporter family permease subunit [Nocardiopsis sp. EMB25]MCY9787182.1 iron chelate uptake ABC transporter family permease subunit [Nocardiopsis sp. EMB25]
MTTTTGGGAGAAPAVRPRGRFRAPLGFVLLGAGLAVAAACSLAVGANPLPLHVVADALLDTDLSDPEHLIVVDRRVPRTLVGLAAGAALGMAGAVMQGLTRNPLADPGLLGINAGASLCVVAAISLLGVTSPGGYVWFAFAGAALAATVVYGVSSLGREGATPVKLALAGAAVTAALTSIVTAVLLVDQSTLDQMRFWQVGALASRDLSVFLRTAPFVMAGAAVALGLGRALNGLALGEDVARGLGQNLARTRGLAAVAIIALCGAATAAVGPIGFVGLLVPHAARFVVGLDYRLILPFSALAAPTLLLVCDVVARVVARPGELQVGIVTAAIGAPLFIALVRRGRAVRL